MVFCITIEIHALNSVSYTGYFHSNYRLPLSRRMCGKACLKTPLITPKFASRLSSGTQILKLDRAFSAPIDQSNFSS